MNKNVSTYHIPVLCSEVITQMNLKPGGVYVDATFGGGGHTQALLAAEPSCHVIGIDWDIRAIELNGESAVETFGERLSLIWGNFARIDNLLQKEGIAEVDGILADFGTSQYQLGQRAGFSFNRDTPLDMRMSPAHQKITAAEVLNKSSEEVLAEIFFRYGQERRSRLYAKVIVEVRVDHPFQTTRDLALLIERLAGPLRKKHIHPATQVFQALRIYINKELENIRSFLPAALRVLKPGGRLLCISFHSLEDGLVKDFFREQAAAHILSLVVPKGIVATAEEVGGNPASRSARLRVAEILKK